MSVVVLPRFSTLRGNDPSVLASIFGTDHTPPKTVFQGVADPILAFGRIAFNGSTNPVGGIGGSSMPTATECALHWCVQTLDTSIQNSFLNQTIVGTWSNDSAVDTSDVHLRPDLASTAGGKGSAVDYYVSPMSNLPLVKFLEDAFNTTVHGFNLPGAFTQQELSDLTMYSSDTAQALWSIDNLDGLMRNLADRMTDALRNINRDPTSGADTLGKVYTTQTYVLVTWRWLILPVGLVLASCMVLFAAIFSSSRHQTIVWKSSSLAVLFHGLVGGDGRTGHSTYKKQMEVTAEEMEVQLVEITTGDLHLVEVDRQFNKASKSHSRWWTNWYSEKRRS